MEILQIVKILSGPLIGAVIGYFTNMIAVKMLFYPKKEIRIFGRRLPLTPGVIPKGRPRLAVSIGQTVQTYLLTNEDIKAHLLSPQVEQKITDVASEILSRNIKEALLSLADIDSDAYEQKKSQLSQTVSLQIVKTIQSSNATETVLAAVGESIKNKVNYTPLKLLVNDMTLKTVMQPAKEMLDTMIDERGTEYITPILQNKLSEADSGSVYDLLRQFDVDEQSVKDAVAKTYRKLVDQSVEGIMQSINFSALVEDKINAMSIDELERLVEDVMKKELSAIINLGALIGFILGLLNLIL